MKINETIDNAVRFKVANLTPGQVFYYPSMDRYFIMTNKEDGWHNGIYCVNLLNGTQLVFCGHEDIIPCQEAEITVRRST